MFPVKFLECFRVFSLVHCLLPGVSPSVHKVSDQTLHSYRDDFHLARVDDDQYVHHAFEGDELRDEQLGVQAAATAATTRSQLRSQLCEEHQIYIRLLDSRCSTCFPRPF